MSSTRCEPAKSCPASLIDSIYDLQTSYVYLLLPVILTVGYFFVFHLGLPWALIFLVYGCVPKIDSILKLDWKNPTLEEIEQLEKNQRFRAVLYITIAVDWLFLSRGLSAIYYNTMPIWQLIPLTFLLLNLSAGGFLVAHQLFHKANLTDRVVGTTHQIKNLYMHFTIEHLYGHHKWVATPRDPATARQGITLYEFIPKSIVGGFCSAFRINPLFVALSAIMQVIFVGAVWKVYDTKTVVFYLLYAAGGIFILELINYIEHYGLQRKVLEDGSYVKVNIRHSWNAPHRLSNYLFFKLQRHSDHHENSFKPYQTLCSYEDSPQLPHGYLVCLLIALWPKKWFDMMDPLVEQYRKSEKGTNLKALKKAEQKAQDFTNRMFLVLATLMLVELVLHYGI